jgi:hypothetical protein
VDVAAIDLRVQSAQHFRALWLDGLPDGGVFVPGLVGLAAATPVVLRVIVDEPKPSTTFLRGSVAWRRLQAGAAGGDLSSSSVLLRPGSGVAFEAAMRPRLIFLERLERGAANDGRSGSRYPTRLSGELMVRDGERALQIRVDDIGTHGARVRLPTKAYVIKDTAVRLWLAWNSSGASSFAPLPGRVMWVDRVERDGDRVGGEDLGVQLDLGSKEDRLHWARVFRGCQQDYERHATPSERRVG